MRLSLPSRISLRTKFIIFIGAIISASYLFILYRTSVFDESMILRNAEQQARMLYKQILLTRQWASDHNGLFILKREGIEMNPYLDLPTVKDNRGHTYYMRNPAMITRELSKYAKKDGLGHFRVTSLNPVNPLNIPDDFERKSLLSFSKDTQETFAVENSAHGRNVRFIAPLMVTESCLNCHSRHGYKFGDIRGGLSITIPINWADDLINKNTQSLIFIGVVSIFLVTVTFFLMFESLVVHRIQHLSRAMDAFPDTFPEEHLMSPVFKDELDSVNDNFILFCDRLKKSQTDLIKAHKQAHLNEKMASLGVLTAGIAHEVNNPLGGMLNCVKSMSENPEDKELMLRYLPLIDKGLRQIEQTMKQLLNFGRTEPLTLRNVDIQTLVEECTELLSFRHKNIHFVIRISLSTHYLLDAEALKQIIINMGLNAIQAMDDGGELIIECKRVKDQLVFVFQDSGNGIAEKHLPYIFDPFFTTKGVGEGTGLGLAVTYTLVQRMEGRISVDSTAGEGTVFTIALPISGQHS